MQEFTEIVEIENFEDSTEFEEYKTIEELKIELPIDNNGKYNIEQIKNHFLHAGLIKEESISELIKQSIEIFRKEPNVIEVNERSVVYGDYHAQYFDFLEQIDLVDYLRENGMLQNQKENEVKEITEIDFVDEEEENENKESEIQKENEMNSKPDIVRVYLGDYVDRGDKACEILISLLCEKVNNPSSVVMLRGNHESRHMSFEYGFFMECKNKYSEKLYDEFVELFSTLPVACIISCGNWRYFCCHGGITNPIATIEMINEENRFFDTFENGTLINDLLWADPVDRYAMKFKSPPGTFDNSFFYGNPDRGTSHSFSKSACKAFLGNNNCHMMIRAHEPFIEGCHICHFGSINPADCPCISIFGKREYSLMEYPQHPGYYGPNKAGAVALLESGLFTYCFETEKYSKLYHENNFYAYDRCIERIGIDIQTIFNALKKMMKTDLEKIKRLEKYRPTVSAIPTPFGMKGKPLEIKMISKKSQQTQDEKIRKQRKEYLKSLNMKGKKPTNMTKEEVKQLEEKWSQTTEKCSLKINNENIGMSTSLNLNSSFNGFSSFGGDNNSSSFNKSVDKEMKFGMNNLGNSFDGKEVVVLDKRHRLIELNATIGTEKPVKYESQYASRLPMEDSSPITMKQLSEEMKGFE